MGVTGFSHPNKGQQDKPEYNQGYQEVIDLDVLGKVEARGLLVDRKEREKAGDLCHEQLVRPDASQSLKTGCLQGQLYYQYSLPGC